MGKKVNKDVVNVMRVSVKDIEAILRELVAEDQETVEKSKDVLENESVVKAIVRLTVENGDMPYKYLPLDERILDLYLKTDHLDNELARKIRRRASEFLYKADNFTNNGISINNMAKIVHETNVKNGFNKFDEDFLGNIALVHSELSEAVEEFRAGKPSVYFGEDGKPEGVAIELIDAMIRIMNILTPMNIDIEKCFFIKDTYNGTRGYLHGKNR
ncbi:MAG: hypothetical protein WC175_04055 [Candidatus Dojkabacteria bacterium]